MDDSNSNRNARFDSYSILMQTADSQVPSDNVTNELLNSIVVVLWIEVVAVAVIIIFIIISIRM